MGIFSRPKNPAVQSPADGLADRPISRDAAIWALRLFLGREPTDEAEISYHRHYASLAAMRDAFVGSEEFQDYYKRGRGASVYAAPLFLLNPPPAGIPWRFAPPSLVAPVSQLCTETQMTEPAYARWCHALGIPASPHRKMWEFCYVAAVMETAGVLRPGARALGFGVGAETLPAFLASRGLEVLASDAPADVIQGQGWDITGQHAANLESLFRADLVSREAFDRLVSFRAVDMNNIPQDLRGFDVCWSSCCFEHLGSIAHGLDFFVASLDTLQPGGIAVHTTEFNLTSNDATYETPNLSLFRRRDIEAMVARLVAMGHTVWPLNLYPGDGTMDEHIDLPPYDLPHLKLKLGEYVSTSIGIVAQKKAG